MMLRKSCLTLFIHSCDLEQQRILQIVGGDAGGSGLDGDETYLHTKLLKFMSRLISTCIHISEAQIFCLAELSRQ